MFCKHEWEVVSDRTLPSPLEVLTDIGASYKSGGDIPIAFFEVVHICLMYCRKCGKTKQFRNSNIGT